MEPRRRKFGVNNFQLCFRVGLRKTYAVVRSGHSRTSKNWDGHEYGKIFEKRLFSSNLWPSQIISSWNLEKNSRICANSIFRHVRDLGLGAKAQTILLKNGFKCLKDHMTFGQTWLPGSRKKWVPTGFPRIWPVVSQV